MFRWLSVLENFADFDTDHDGRLGLEEFRRLWEHLGGDKRAAAVEAEAEDELVGVWQRYDESDRGHLVRVDVARLLADLGYDATDDYIAGIMEVYGSFDAKDDAVVEYAEFAALWAHLGGGVTSKSDGALEAIPQSHPLRDTFLRYDKNGEGHISEFEVSMMMQDLGYEVESEYVAGVMRSFASWDEDGDGVLGFDEFVQLWAHLDGDAETGAETGADPLSAEFAKYAVGGSIGPSELLALMTAHGFAPTDDYLDGVLGAMASADKNADGRITIDEFPELCTFLGLGTDGK